MLTIKYNYTEKDLVNYNYYVRWKSPYKRIYRLKSYATSVGLYAILIAATMNASFDGGWTLRNTILIGIAWLVAAVLLTDYNMRRQFKKQVQKSIADSGKESYIPQTTLTFNESGIVSAASGSVSHYGWSEFENKVIFKENYFLHLNSDAPLMVPKAALSTDERAELENIFLKYFPLHSELKRMEKSRP